MASRKYGTLYVGVTSNLMQRIQKHREKLLQGFSSKNDVRMFVWFEQLMTMETAIIREKRVKNWNRQWRINLIEHANPDWRDLAVDFGFPMLPKGRFDL
jgi:putative endonuclease